MVGVKGGYLVYVDYEIFEVRMLGIFLVWDIEGVVFSKNDNNIIFNFDVIIYLNMDRLVMVCRIYFGKVKDGMECCVELIKYVKS